VYIQEGKTVDDVLKAFKPTQEILKKAIIEDHMELFMFCLKHDVPVDTTYMVRMVVS
jgi:hypothetical protein